MFDKKLKSRIKEATVLSTKYVLRVSIVGGKSKVRQELIDAWTFYLEGLVGVDNVFTAGNSWTVIALNRDVGNLVDQINCDTVSVLPDNSCAKVQEIINGAREWDNKNYKVGSLRVDSMVLAG